jgi:hypothetical protein
MQDNKVIEYRAAFGRPSAITRRSIDPVSIHRIAIGKSEGDSAAAHASGARPYATYPPRQRVVGST